MAELTSGTGASTRDGGAHEPAPASSPVTRDKPRTFSRGRNTLTALGQQ